MADAKAKPNGTADERPARPDPDRDLRQRVAEPPSTAKGSLDFEALVGAIARVHEQLVTHAVRAVNVSLTLRNWCIGCYIAEYELTGSDRAAYGASLFSALAERLTALGVANCNRRQLYRYRDFYAAYPAIVGALSPQLQALVPTDVPAHQKVGAPSPQFAFPPEQLLNRLSYSHLEQLTAIGEPLKRAFYEAECIRGNWSVRELKRQIASLYYERSGLSKDKRKLAAMARAEARHKRILIGGDLFFVDLVFYHRILKCHILIELKVDAFTHEHLGQLNTYVT